MRRARLGWWMVLAASLAGCTTPAPDLPPAPAVVPIDVVRRDWHTDLCLDPHDLTGRLAAYVAALPSAPFLCFGFGEQHYMFEQDHSLGAMLGSLLPSRAVLVLTPLHRPAAEVVARTAGENGVVTVRVSRPGIANFSEAVWRTFKLNPDGTPVRLGRGAEPDAIYFSASDSYSAASTCNTWTATALRAAGLPVDDAVIFESDLMQQVREIAKRQAQQPSG